MNITIITRKNPRNLNSLKYSYPDRNHRDKAFVIIYLQTI